MGGSGPPLQTLVVLWRGGKLWQARATYGKLSKWNPTNWHRLESQHSHSYELLLTQTVFRLGGCGLFGVKSFWGVDVFLGRVDFFGV